MHNSAPPAFSHPKCIKPTPRRHSEKSRLLPPVQLINGSPSVLFNSQTPTALCRQRRTSLCQSVIEETTPQAILPKTYAPGRRIIPTSINLKTLRKQSGSLGSPTVPHSPDSHASTTTPLSPLGGGDSHFGDTIQSNNSTQTGESVSELSALQSPLAHTASALVSSFSGRAFSSTRRQPKSRHQPSMTGTGAAYLISRMATANRQSAADRSILSWHELDVRVERMHVLINPF